MNYDVLVVGSGPAGLAAAVAARGRDKSVLVVGNPWQESPLARAEQGRLVTVKSFFAVK